MLKDNRKVTSQRRFCETWFLGSWKRIHRHQEAWDSWFPALRTFWRIFNRKGSPGKYRHCACDINSGYVWDDAQRFLWHIPYPVFRGTMKCRYWNQFINLWSSDGTDNKSGTSRISSIKQLLIEKFENNFSDISVPKRKAALDILQENIASCVNLGEER